MFTCIQVHLLNEEINSLRLENSSAIAGIEELKFQLELKANEAIQLSGERDKFREDLVGATDKLERAYSESLKFQRELEDLKKMLAKVELNYEESSLEAQKLQQKYNTAEVTVSKLRIDCEGSREEAAALRSEMERLTSEHAQKTRTTQKEFEHSLKKKEQDKQALE